MLRQRSDSDACRGTSDYWGCEIMVRTVMASPVTFDLTNYIETMRSAFTISWKEHVRHWDGPVVLVYRGTVVFPEDYLHRLLAVCGRNSAATAHCVYWRAPDGSACIGIGAAVDTTVSGDLRFADVKQVIAEHPAHPATNETTGHGSDVAAKWFVGGAFAVQSRHAPWTHWSDARAILPEFLFEQTADGRQTLSCQVVFEQGDMEENIPAILHSVEGRLGLLVEQAKRLDGAVVDATNTEMGSSTTATTAPPATTTAATATSGTAWLAATATSATTSANAALLTPVSPPDESRAFLTAVADTAADIRARKYTKAVLARRAVVNRAEEMTVDRVVPRLEAQNRETFVFAFRADEEWFVGASPERLVQLSGGEVAVDCLAGTTSRSNDAAADEQLGAELLASTKDRDEHHVVVRWVTENLAGLVDDLEFRTAPTLKKLRNVQHLWTAVSGRVRQGANVLDLVDRLHPTPAVAGRPRDVALEVIAEREQMDRGWYAGPIGWVDSRGDGEFAVALRSALFTETEVHLYAGAGIMGDSKPESEWRETALKLRAMQAAIAPHDDTVNETVATAVDESVSTAVAESAHGERVNQAAPHTRAGDDQ